MKIEVGGKKYKVTENLGFQAGFLAKAVETESGENIAVKRASGLWEFWGVEDRIRPSRNIVGQSEAKKAQPMTAERGRE